MARKEENIRKRSKDYLEEYTEASLKVKAVEARIKERTLNLCKRYPDVDVRLSKDSTPATAKLYAEIIEDNPYYEVSVMLKVMRKIEEHIDSLHPHQQQKMF